MDKKIAVVGAGAIGSSVGADLTDAGHDVVLIDYWPAHVERMKTDGLRIRIENQELLFPVNALHLCELSSANLKLDVLFLASKSNDHRWLAELMKPYLKEDGVLVALQNGMNDDSIASIIGRERIVGCVVELSAELFEPAVVKRNTARAKTWFALGELDGSRGARVEELASILGVAGRVEVTDNIYGAKWTKLIANTMTMGPFGLLGLYNGQAAQLPGMFRISVQLGKESLAVGQALGYRIEPIFGLRADELAGSSEENLVTAMRTLISHTSRARTAPVHDHLKGRNSEIPFISGLVSAKGREVGIPTPANDAVVELDRQINAGELLMDPSNFDRLKERLGIEG